MEPAEAADGCWTSTSGRQTFVSDVNDRHLHEKVSDDGPKVSAGRLLLGRRESAPHVMQYSINARQQLNDINNDVLSDDCLPFRHCPGSRRCAAVVWLWSFIRSETVLYALHVISIALGAVNSGRLYSDYLSVRILQNTAVLTSLPIIKQFRKIILHIKRAAFD